MISRRTSDVNRAVALIDPDAHLRAECVNAVHVALSEMKGTEATVHRSWDRYTKRGKRAMVRLEAAIRRLQHALDDPIISAEFATDETRRLLERLRAESAARSKVKPPFRFAAEKKLDAAAWAYRLLLQFNRDAFAVKGSTFCKLAALLHGTPKRDRDFLYPCRKVVWANNDN